MIALSYDYFFFLSHLQIENRFPMSNNKSNKTAFVLCAKHPYK